MLFSFSLRVQVDPIRIEFLSLDSLVAFLQEREQAKLDARAAQLNALAARLAKTNAELNSSVTSNQQL